MKRCPFQYTTVIVAVVVFLFCLQNYTTVKIERLGSSLHFVNPGLFHNSLKHEIHPKHELKPKHKWVKWKSRKEVRWYVGLGALDTNKRAEEMNLAKEREGENKKDKKKEREKEETTEGSIKHTEFPSGEKKQNTSENVVKTFTDGEILTEEEINEHMRYQQWADRFIMNKEKHMYYDSNNTCATTRQFYKISQINDKFYRKGNVVSSNALQLIPFEYRIQKKKTCDAATQNVKKKLSYDMFLDKNEKIPSVKEQTKINVTADILEDVTENWGNDKEEIISEEQMKYITYTDVDIIKRTNMLFPKKSLLNSIYIGKEAFNDFLEKGMDSVKFSLNKYQLYYYEHNLNCNPIEEKTYLMYLLRYIKSYILKLIYRTFQMKLLNEVEIENGNSWGSSAHNESHINQPSFLDESNEYLNKDIYLDMETEYEEILNTLTNFINRLQDFYKINEKEVEEYLLKTENKALHYTTPYAFNNNSDNNNETENHIKQIWNFFNSKIFQYKLPHFDCIQFFWMKGEDKDKWLYIKNMKTYKIINEDSIALPNILILSNLKNSPVLLNYTILKIMYEYYKLIKTDILNLKQVKYFETYKKFDEMKQTIIKYVHGISGLMENIDFYFYTPFIGDINLSDKQSTLFFSYLRNKTSTEEYNQLLRDSDKNKMFLEAFAGNKTEVDSFSKKVQSLEFKKEIHDMTQEKMEKTEKTEKEQQIRKNENDRGYIVREEEQEKNQEKEPETETETETERREEEEEDDLVCLLLKSGATKSVENAVQLATNVIRKKNVNSIWGHVFDSTGFFEDVEKDKKNKKEQIQNIKEKEIKKKMEKKQETNQWNEGRFRIPLNEFAASLFLKDVNNSTKYLTQAIEKLKELTESDLTYVHNALTYACLKFVHDSGDENENVEDLLKQFEKKEKVETTNNIMALQMMVVIGDVFRNIRKMRSKEKFFFQRILQTDVLADMYNDTSIYDEKMNMQNVKYVIKNLKIDYPFKSNIQLNETNREEIAYYFLNCFTKYLFRCDLPNNIVIKFTNGHTGMHGLSFSDYNFDYIQNDVVIYINDQIKSSLLLSRIILDECLYIYEKYTTFIHKYGGNVDNATVKQAKETLQKEEEGNSPEQMQGDINSQEKGEIDETIEEVEDNEDEDEENEENEYEEEKKEEEINTDYVDMNTVKEVSGLSHLVAPHNDSHKEKANAEKKLQNKSAEVIDDENVDIFNYVKINRIKQFIRFIIEYNDWPIFLDDTVDMEYYLNEKEKQTLRKSKKKVNTLNNLYSYLKLVSTNSERIMEILENSIKRENCRYIWSQKKIPIKHIAAAIFTNNYVNLFSILQKGMDVLIHLDLDDINFIMNKCKSAAEIVYYKRLEEIKSTQSNLIFTMYNENLSAIEYFFDKLKEKIILIRLIKNKDIFNILVNIISEVLPNATKNNKQINEQMNNITQNNSNDVKNKEKNENTKEQIKKLLFLYDHDKQSLGITNHLNRESVTYNLFHYFNREIFNNKINKNVSIQFINDDSILSTHDNHIDTFKNSTIYLNKNIFSVVILANVLLKEMAEIYYFYNDNRIETENKLYLKNEFKSKYLPYIFKYAQSVITTSPVDSSFNFGNVQKESPQQSFHYKTKLDQTKGNNTIEEEKSKGNLFSADAVTKYYTEHKSKEQLSIEKDQYDMNLLINKIAYYDHADMFKEILHFRKVKYNDNADVQKCLEEYLLTYDKINTIKYCTVEKEKGKETEDGNAEAKAETKNGKEKTMEETEKNINDEYTKNTPNSNANEKQLFFEPSDIKNVFLHYMYQYIEHIIQIKHMPISFNRISESWINCLTDLENQKIINYSTSNFTGHLYNLLVNSKACSPKRALDILSVSLSDANTDPDELTEIENVKETTISSTELNDSIKNFDDFVLWISKNKKKRLETLDTQHAINNAPQHLKEDVKQVIQEHNHLTETGDNSISENIDMNNITIENVKDLIKKHNISKEELTSAMNQLHLDEDIDIDQLYES